MATKTGNILVKTSSGKANFAPNTITTCVADPGRGQALSASLESLIEKNALGYPTFSTLSNYPVGGTVFYDRKLWTFTTAHPAGAWNASHVREANIKELLIEAFHNETYSKEELDSLITTPDVQYVSVSSYAELPETGEADTIYRVGNWDGSQVATDVYCEYAWDGNAYVHLSTKTNIGEVFDISAYHATGGELAKYADLAAALGINGANIPQSLHKGGMSIKFVQSSDNKYVQFRYTGTAVAGTPNPFLETDNWQNMEIADAVLYTIQEKTELEKERARQNIGASWNGIHTISDYSLDLLLEILSNAVYTTPQYDNVQEVINNIRSTGQSTTVVVKEPSISYGENGEVLMRTITSGASIKYTLDGTTPTKNVGNLYEAPFYPNMDCTIKAVAYKDNVVSIVSEFEYDNSVTYIRFEDPVVEAFLVSRVDTNGDGRIQFTEAAALSNFPNTWFAGDTDIVYFNEFKFFTGISQIKNSSFQGCTNLKSIEIPNSVTYIGTSVFKNCSSLKHVIIGDHVETIDTYAFQNCVSLEEITIPASVKVIKGFSFNNSGLKTIVIPDTVTTLGGNVFRGCLDLKSIIIGNGLTTLIGDTGRNCPLLELVDLGNGITSVGSMEFAGSNNLKTVICRATTPPTLGSGALPYVNIDIYVPDSSVAAYTSSSWKTSKTTIHSINEL